jgi:hypothetical protein
MSPGLRMVSLLIGVPIEAFLALALLSDSRPVASMYTLGSTHSGAAILWVGAELFTFLLSSRCSSSGSGPRSARRLGRTLG